MSPSIRFRRRRRSPVANVAGPTAAALGRPSVGPTAAVGSVVVAVAEPVAVGSIAVESVVVGPVVVESVVVGPLVVGSVVVGPLVVEPVGSVVVASDVREAAVFVGSVLDSGRVCGWWMLMSVVFGVVAGRCWSGRISSVRVRPTSVHPPFAPSVINVHVF